MPVSEKHPFIPLRWALVPFVVMVATMTATIIVFQGAPHIPLIIGATTAGLVAWYHGFSWGQIEKALYDGIVKVLPAVVILMLIGLLISSWVAGGLVGAMVFYGLKFLSADYFLPALMIICAVATLMMGSSWSTIGTLGVAGMATGTSMGLPPAAIAGVIVSGAYFGDKMSPLSDTTVLASGIAQTDIFVHIRHMLYTTMPGLIIALIVYVMMSGQPAGGTATQQIAAVTQALQAHYTVSPWLLVVPLIIPALAMRKIPTIPTLLIGIGAGAVCYLGFQHGHVGDLFNILQSGYTAHTGNQAVDNLLAQGGLQSMMYTVSLATVAMAFGGIMEQTGMLERLVAVVLKVATNGRQLCAITVGSSFLTNIVTAEQYISIIIPGRMYADAYRKHDLHPKNLSRALEDGGTITSALVPWSTDGVFIYSTLGVSAWAYAPYAVLNYSVPLISIGLSLMGIAVAKQIATHTPADRNTQNSEPQADFGSPQGEY